MPQTNTLQFNNLDPNINNFALGEASGSVQSAQAISTQWQQVQQQNRDLDRELGLEIPHDVLTEAIPTWRSFFALMRNIYIEGFFDKAMVTKFKEKFATLTRKEAFINELNELFEEKVAQRDLIFEGLELEEFRWEMEEYAQDLPKAFRQEFLGYVYSGTPIPDDFFYRVDNNIQTTYAPESFEYKSARGILDEIRRKRLTAASLRKEDSSNNSTQPEVQESTFNKPLSPDDVAIMIDGGEDDEDVSSKNQFTSAENLAQKQPENNFNFAPRPVATIPKNLRKPLTPNQAQQLNNRPPSQPPANNQRFQQAPVSQQNPASARPIPMQNPNPNPQMRTAPRPVAPNIPRVQPSNQPINRTNGNGFSRPQNGLDQLLKK